MSKEHNHADISISDLFGKSENFYPKFYKKVKSFGELNILDLGSGIPLNLFLAYHVFNCKSLFFNDSCPEKILVDNFLNQYHSQKDRFPEKLKSAKSFFDIYSSLLAPDKNCETKKIKEEAIFNDIFLKNFNRMPISKFLCSFDIKQDIIIASNIFHLLTPDIYVFCLKRIKQLLVKDGLLIVRIQDKPGFSGTEFLDRLLELYPNSEIFNYSKDEKWHHSIIINQSGLLN